VCLIFDYILLSKFNHRHTSLKKKHEPKHPVRPNSQKKLNNYIHHVVVNNLPPTVQVGGPVINSPRLPLPPIPLPYTAPPNITTSRPHATATKKITMDEEIQSVPKLHLSDMKNTDDGIGDEMDHVSQTVSTISLGSNELISANSNDNNNITMSDMCDKTFTNSDHDSKSPSSVNDPIIKLIKMTSSKLPKKSLGHIKRLPTHSSPPATIVKTSKHKDGAVASISTDHKLPVLRNRSIHQSSSFDVLRNTGDNSSK